ncbi:MAG: LapA family protein [Desulfobacteraceae bacterium]|nr:LapA family protein [Desulfobacteraceae bacterium]
MSRIKPVAMAVIALIAMILFLQNTQTVETRILFFTIAAPRAILLIATFLLGMTAGALAAVHFSKRSK